LSRESIVSLIANRAASVFYKMSLTDGR